MDIDTTLSFAIRPLDATFAVTPLGRSLPRKIDREGIARDCHSNAKLTDTSVPSPRFAARSRQLLLGDVS
jgi:hypothetical protein